MPTKFPQHDLDLGPASASDKHFLIEKVSVAKALGSYSFGFKSASLARSARRRIYHIITQMSEYDQKLMKMVEFQLKGRMIAIIPKTMLSTSITEENAG